MMVDGTFDEMTVDGDRENTWGLESVPFEQDGFSFRAYVDIDTHPLFDEGDTVRGIIDDTVVARGRIVRLSPCTRNGTQMLRLIINPPNHDSVNSEDIELTQS